MSPFFVDQIVGPKPTMYWVTLTPNFLAGTMWPTSCSAIEMTSATTSARIRSASYVLLDQSSNQPTCPCVCIQDVFQCHPVPLFAPEGVSCITRSTSSVIPRNPIRASRKAATACSLAALSTAGAMPPAAAAREASPTAGRPHRPAGRTPRSPLLLQSPGGRGIWNPVRPGHA